MYVSYLFGFIQQGLSVKHSLVSALAIGSNS